jgi:MFS transporter, ACS family, glucarate transporter
MKLFSGRLRWVLISFIFVMTAIAYIARVNMSVAGQAVQKEYGWSDVQLGWILSALIFGYALLQVPGGRLADRFGPRIVIAVGVLFWSVFTILTAFVPAGLAYSFPLMVLVRALVGAGEAVVYPASNRLVADWIPTNERGVANGFGLCGAGFGSAITPPLITFLMLNLGWKWSFHISALIGVAAGILWYVMARNKPRTHPFISKAELEVIEAGIPAPVKKTDKQNALPWGTIIRDKQVILLSLSYFGFAYAVYIFFSWFFIYVNRARGLDLRSSSFYSMLPFLAMMVAAPLGGWLADKASGRYGKRMARCGLGLVGMTGCALAIATATQVASATISIAVLALGAGAVYFCLSSYWAVTADIGGPSAGSASALMNMVGQIGGITASSLTPVIANSLGWTASFLVAAGLCVLGAIAWFFINPNARLGVK